MFSQFRSVWHKHPIPRTRLIFSLNADEDESYVGYFHRCLIVVSLPLVTFKDNAMSTGLSLKCIHTIVNRFKTTYQAVATMRRLLCEYSL